MICRPCKQQRHDECVDIHLLNSGRNGCACQHRAGGFTTSTLNSDGTRSEGIYGATGARGSALTLFDEGGALEPGHPVTNTTEHPIEVRKVLPDDSTISRILREVDSRG